MKRNFSIIIVSLLIVSLLVGAAFATDSLMDSGLIVMSDAAVSSDVPEMQSDVCVSSAESVLSSAQADYISEAAVSSDAISSSSELSVELSSPEIETSDEQFGSFVSFVSDFDVKNLTYEDYVTIESYINFHLTHTLDTDETEQINSLLKNGTPMGTIWDIYEFYLTTNEDFSIIARIASYEDRYWGKNWIENAYNDITDNKHGVIEREQAASYLERFDTSEILYANVLSRKGIYTIDEILDKHSDGTAWNDITYEIYSKLPSDEVSGSKKERQQISERLKDEIYDYDSSPFEVYNFAFLCAKNGITLDSEEITGENIAEYKMEVYDKIDETQSDITNKILRSLSLLESFMTSDEHLEYNKKYYNEAIENGISERDIELLERKGFTMREIAEASVDKGGNPDGITQHIKSQRGDMLK